MGTIQHHAILITGDRAYTGSIETAHVRAVAVFGDLVSEIVDSRMNGHAHFLVAPDGSKEWWPESDAGDGRRESYKQWLHSVAGTLDLSWVEVTYGESQYAILDSDQGVEP